MHKTSSEVLATTESGTTYIITFVPAGNNPVEVNASCNGAEYRLRAAIIAIDGEKAVVGFVGLNATTRRILTLRQDLTFHRLSTRVAWNNGYLF